MVNYQNFPEQQNKNLMNFTTNFNFKLFSFLSSIRHTSFPPNYIRSIMCHILIFLSHYFKNLYFLQVLFYSGSGFINFLFGRRKLVCWMIYLDLDPGYKNSHVFIQFQNGGVFCVRDHRLLDRRQTWAECVCVC